MVVVSSVPCLARGQRAQVRVALSSCADLLGTLSVPRPLGDWPIRKPMKRGSKARRRTYARKLDVARAVEAARAVGLTVTSLELTSDGIIRINSGKLEGTAVGAEFDRWDEAGRL